MERGPAHPDHAFVVYQSIRRRIEPQQALFHVHATSLGDLLGDECHHQVERDVCQPRLVLRIASGDVGVVPVS